MLKTTDINWSEVPCWVKYLVIAVDDRGNKAAFFVENLQGYDKETKQLSLYGQKAIASSKYNHLNPGVYPKNPEWFEE